MSIRLFGNGDIGRSGRGSIEVPDIWWPVVGCLLAVPGRRMSRGRLAGELWPDKDEAAARHCLASALWRIKGQLPTQVSPLDINEDWIAFRADRRTWVDALVFEHRVRAVLAHPAELVSTIERQRLARAMALYGNDFLVERDQDSIRLERERLRALYLDGMYELAMAQANAEDWAAAKSSASSLCLVEPLREDAQRLLIIATARCGNRALALRLYRNFELLLARELGVAPMPETTAVITAISGSAVAPRRAGNRQVDYRLTVIEARDQIAQTLCLLENSLSN